jgi:hypothetical protein
MDISGIGRTASGSTTAPPAATEPTPAPVRSAPPAIPREQRHAADAERDALGEIIPSRLRDAMANLVVPESAALLKRTLRQLEGDTINNPWLLIGRIKPLLEEAADLCEMAVPYAVHPACDGKGCEACRHFGFVTEAIICDLQVTERWDKPGAA